MTETFVLLAGVGIVGLFAIGLVGLTAKRNLVKVLLGLGILGKAATLTFVFGGFVLDDLGRAQAIVFTIIVIEVIVIALALAFMVNVHETTGKLSVTGIRRLRG